MTRPRAAVVVGVALILGAYGTLFVTGPQPPDVWRAAITGVGILGAALVIRTIGPRDPPRDSSRDDYPDGPPPL